MYRNALTINGRSFPHTERIEPMVGDTLRWRWINASGRNHPMHLHGFYFRVDAKGDGLADTSYAVAARRLAVTENMRPGDSVAPPLRIAAGVPHRFRFVNIGMAVRLRFSLRADADDAIWRPLAKDGADLPAAQARPGPAALSLSVGETADVAFLPAGSGDYRLAAAAPDGRVVWHQEVVAR